MIVRPKLNWFALLLVVRGSVLPRIALRLLGVTLLAVVATLIHGRVLDWKVSLNFVPFSLIGLTLAIFLSFRNSTAYARYWEARTLWGSLLNASRSLAAQALTLPQHPAQPADGTSAHDFILRLCAFAQALRHQLRGTDPAADLARFLPADEVAALLAKTPVTASATTRLLLALHQWVAGHTHAGRLPPAVVPAMLRRLDHLCDALGGCQRIGNTPIPFTYTVIIHRCVYLYCVLLPFGLVDSLGWMTPVIVCFIAYTFLALDALGAELEDPFGIEPNDLALEALAHGIEASVLSMAGELPRTPEPHPVDFVLR